MLETPGQRPTHPDQRRMISFSPSIVLLYPRPNKLAISSSLFPSTVEHVKSHLKSHHVIADAIATSQLELLQPPHLTMSALRCRPWRALETLQHARSISQAPRIRISHQQFPSAIPTRAISNSATRPQDNAAKPTPATNQASPTSSTTSSPASRVSAGTPNRPTTDNISKSGLADKPLELETAPEEKIDWTRSFHGLSAEPFPKEVADILLAEADPAEIEIKPDGIVYLPEIKYRRILNRAFGPGGWGLVPRSESIVTPKTVTREYALVCNGR